ncbi:MAG: nuclear transport factor 2 family protein [Actinomycetota bacterium]|nr:nuclear transport factor 2 family protein [Actinomycetota bacterium]
MSEREVALAREGLAAWRRGDFARVEAMLAPDATWRWWEPGEWDCANREEILRTLRERYEQGFGKADMEFVDGGPDAVIVVSHPSEIGGEEWPKEAATVLSFEGDKVVEMQDYRTRDEAAAAISGR